MDPVLQAKLTEILDYLLQTTKAGVDFASQQLPLIAWEQVAFARAWYTVVTTLCVLMGGVLLWRWPKIREYDKTLCIADRGLPTTVATVAFVVLGIATVMNLHAALQVWFAPRVYLLNWAAELVRQAKS